jgi:hypothetical protein
VIYHNSPAGLFKLEFTFGGAAAKRLYDVMYHKNILISIMALLFETALRFITVITYLSMSLTFLLAT